MKPQSKPLSRQTDLVIQDLQGEILIYDLQTNQAFCLNETSALVWQACDGSRTVGEISGQISGRLNSPVSEDFVWLALEQLKKENLIENSREVLPPFEGLSRREVIRKVGFASLIALPVISSLVAPTAAHAASATNLAAIGAACTSNNNCASTCCANDKCITPGLSANGAICRTNCQCNSGTCDTTVTPNRCTSRGQA